MWPQDLVFLFSTISSARKLFLFQGPRHPISSLIQAHFLCSQEGAQQEETAWFSMLSSELVDVKLGQPCHNPVEEQLTRKSTLPVARETLERGMARSKYRKSPVDSK